MKVSIVIPWFNNEALVATNLAKVAAAAKKSDNIVSEIIVVDDGSKDNTASLIKKMFPEVKLIRHKKNRGFPSAVNTGVRASKGDLICLLNNDVIPEPNFLEPVIEHFKNPKIFGVSLNESGEFGWSKGFFEDGFIGHQVGGKSDKAHITFWVSGGSGVFRRKIWMELNGMDEKLFSPFYWEDLDISYRAMKRGYQILWEPNAKVAHNHRTTINQLNPSYVKKIVGRNQLLFMWKNITSGRLLRKHIAGLFRRVFRRPGYILLIVMALAKIAPLTKARVKEIKESKVSDEAILARFS